MSMRQRALLVFVLLAMSLISVRGASAKTLTPANQNGPVTVQITTQCSNKQTVVNLPIDPTQIQSITVSGKITGPISLTDKNGSINATGNAPYSFTISKSDALLACVAGSGTGTVSFAGQLNMFTGNWAGYTVEGFTASPNTYQIVNGNWNVPSLTCSGIGSDSATWVGLGGAPNTGSKKIEQIGTEQDCVLKSAVFFPVFENFPDGVQKITSVCKAASQNTCVATSPTIKAGDAMRAQVINRGNGVFLLFLQDSTQGWYVNEFGNEVGGADPSVQYTAEWVEEFPDHFIYSGLANFQNVTFTNCLADGFPINGPSIQQITMKHNGGVVMAVPGTLSGSGTSFSISFAHS